MGGEKNISAGKKSEPKNFYPDPPYTPDSQWGPRELRVPIGALKISGGQ
jgi:hypothetical protein